MVPPSPFGAASLLVRFCAVVFVLVAALGCNGPEEDIKCSRDSALLDAKRVCRTDPDCPCGAHCTLGQCSADCRSSDACAGNAYCDAFGRCRSKGDRSVTPPIEPAGSKGAVLNVAPSYVEALQELPRAVRLEALGGDLGRVRVLASAPVEVACGAEPAFARECSLESIAQGAPSQVRLRSTAALATAATVRVYVGTALKTISIGAPAIARDAASTLGHYEGVAELVAAGVGLNAEPLPRAQVTVKVGVKADITGAIGNAVFQLTDESKLIHPRGTWVAGFALEQAGGGTLRFPRYRGLTGAVGVGADSEVVTEAADAAVAVDGDRLSFELTERNVGVLQGARAPAQTWRFTLLRKAALPAAFVPLPILAPALAQLDPARAGQRTPWEALLVKTFAPMPGFGRPEVGAFGLQRAFAGEEAWVDACGRKPSEIAILRPYMIVAEFTESSSTKGVDNGFVVASTSGARTLDQLDTSADYMARVLANTLRATPSISNVVVSNWTSGSEFSAIAAEPLLPCAFSSGSSGSQLEVLQLNFGFGQAAIGPAPTAIAVDRCNEIARKYNCTIEPSALPYTLAWSGSGTVLSNGTTRGFTSNLVSFRATSSKACRMPSAPASCDSALLCHEPPLGAGPQARETMQSATFSGVPRPQSLELSCRQGARSAATDLVENGELVDGSAGKLSANEAQDACRADLNRFFTRSANSITPARNGEGTRAVFTPSRCFDGARWIAALGSAAESSVGNAVRGRAFMHLLSQWLDMHLFLAREALQNERMGPILRKAPVAGRAAPLPLDRELAAALRVWGVLMHPRFAGALAGMPDEAIYAPDYRSEIVNGVVNAPLGQADAPSVKLLELLSIQLQLAELGVDRAALASDATRLSVSDQVLAFAPLVLAIAHDLDARGKAAQAKQSGPPPVWAIRQQRAFDRVQGTLNSVLIKAQGVRDGKNPLGIEDEDTPLYFLAANNLGPGKRFSAVSDYLIGEPGPNSTGWATSLTRQASVTLDAAREAWSQQSARELQDKLTSQQQLDRAADSAASYGDPILQMCGAIEGVNKYTAIDNVKNINPETCWVRTELNECRVSAKNYAKTLTTQDVAYQICVVGKLKRDVGGVNPASNIGFVDSRFNALADQGCSLQSQLVVEGCSSTAGQPCFRCVAASGASAGSASEVAFRTDSLATNLAGVPDELKPRASADCLAQFPLAVPRLPNPQAASASLLDSGTCYKGSLGELALTVASAAKAAEAATSEIQDNLDSYGIAVESCNILQTANDTVISKTSEYNDLQSKLRAGKLATDIVASVASAGKDCATAAGSDIFFVAGVIACSAAAVQGAAESVSSGLQFAMDEATQSHDTLVQSLQLTLLQDL